MTGPIMSIVFAAAVLLVAAVGFVWQSRARTHRRRAALDAYAEREIARGTARGALRTRRRRDARARARLQVNRGAAALRGAAAHTSRSSTAAVLRGTVGEEEKSHATSI